MTPTAIRIPSIGVNETSFMTVDLDANKVLQAPPLSQSKVVAFYKRSPLPGDMPACSFADGCVGSSVVSSHINANGVQGTFARLAQLKKGAQIEVDRGDGRTAVFTVTKVDIFQKSAFPTQDVYGDVQTPTIKLVTCGPGQLNRATHNYEQQTVVSAELTTMKRTP